MAKRDTYKYELKDGNSIKYIGITIDPDRRFKEHEQSKEFGHMNIIGSASSRESAKNWESERLEIYRRNHGGNNPKYNKTANGK